MLEQKVSLRPATQEDYDFLWWLHHTTMRPYVEKTWGWDEARQSQHFQERFDPTTREIVELYVLKVNPARGLYERLGFAIIGETETHHIMRSTEY